MPIENFDAKLHESSYWFSEIMKELKYDSEYDAYHALRAVLHALRDRLPIHASMHFAAQLPTLIRGLYFEGWHADAPVKMTSDEFLHSISQLEKRNDEPERVFHGVMNVIAQHTTLHELHDLQTALPQEINEMIKATS